MIPGLVVLLSTWTFALLIGLFDSSRYKGAAIILCLSAGLLIGGALIYASCSAFGK